MVDQMGVYLRDSYDFTGDQGLGFWNKGGVTTYASNTLDIPIERPAAGNDANWTIGIGSLSVNRPRYFSVSNGSFDQYRNATKHGGDFTIFSDVHRLAMLPQNVEIYL